jgi:hypothetical protein
VRDFNKTIARVCDFIGLEFEESMINFHEHSPVWFQNFLDDNQHLRKRSQQMKQPLFDGTGIGASLTDEQAKQVRFDCSGKFYSLLERGNT